MKPRYKITKRQGRLGVFDTETKCWEKGPWYGWGFGKDAEGYCRFLNAPHFRKTFEMIWGNDFALNKPVTRDFRVITNAA